MVVLDQNVPCFRFFEELAAIPHGSHNEKAVSDWLVRFAQTRGLYVRQDPCGNVIIKMPATPGCERAEPVMLQAHMDMVCAKNENVAHDFATDPLMLYVEDGWLKARGTTLGADDGCGVAMILSILDRPELRHPRLECVLTTAEETGMDGARALDYSQLEARRMICLDATGENVILTASAGGCGIEITKPLRRFEGGGAGLRISVNGLAGGHSGMYIAAGRGNAIKLLARCLLYLKQACGEYQLISINGGVKDNAIPCSAYADILCSNAAGFKRALTDIAAAIRAEFQPVEAELRIEAADTMCGGRPVERADAEELLTLIRLLPDGVSVMSRTISGLPQLSDNVGHLTIEEDHAKIELSVRSAITSEMAELIERISLTAAVCGAKAVAGTPYPPISYLPESAFRERYAQIMERFWGVKPVYLSIHAGAEAGYFAEHLPGLEIVTLGPIMENVHSPQEKLNLASFQKCEKFLVQVLECLSGG